MNNSEFLLALGEGHQGRFWVTDFAGDPGQVNGSSWRGHLVHKRSQIPNGDTNSYFSVGMLRENTASRTKDACTAVVAVVLDDVSTDELPENPAPTWVLETSPHNLQVGFALKPGQHPDAVDGLLRGLISAGHCAADSSGNNLVRYVRLPSGVNTKHSVIMDHGAPFPCRLECF
jgi:hypothetical protein